MSDAYAHVLRQHGILNDELTKAKRRIRELQHTIKRLKAVESTLREALAKRNGEIKRLPLAERRKIARKVRE